MVMFPPWKLYYQIKQKEKTFYKNKGAYESVKFFSKTMDLEWQSKGEGIKFSFIRLYSYLHQSKLVTG